MESTDRKVQGLRVSRADILGCSVRFSSASIFDMIKAPRPLQASRLDAGTFYLGLIGREDVGLQCTQG